MSSVKILHCGDLHIGAKETALNEKAEMRRTETLITFEKIVETAKETGVEVCLIAGDLLHSNKTENSFIRRIFELIASAKEIKFVFSAGNHDPLNNDSPFLKPDLPDNLIVMPDNDSVFEIKEGVKVYGRSFCEIINKGEERFSLSADENSVNIMCIHGEYGTNTGRNPITDSFIASSGMDYIALGHIHKRSEIKKIGNTYFAYCGCAEGQGFDETGEKGVYIGTVGKGVCDLSFVPLCRRMHLCEDIDISGLEGPAEMDARITEELKNKYGDNFGEHIYKINLTGSISENTVIRIPEITARLMQKVFYALIKDETVFEFDLEALRHEASLKGIFVSKMLEKIRENPQDSERLNRALKIGLNAFKGEEQNI